MMISNWQTLDIFLVGLVKLVKGEHDDCDAYADDADTHDDDIKLTNLGHIVW